MKKADASCRRKLVLINKGFQGAFALRFLVPGMLITFSLCLIIWYLSARELEGYMFRSHFSQATPVTVIMPIAITASVVSLAVFLAVLYPLTNHLFSRISIQLKLLNRSALELGRGRFDTEIPQAPLKEVYGALNLIMLLDENLRDGLTSLKSIHEEMLRTIQLAQGQDKEKRCQAINKLEELSAEFKTRLDATRIQRK